MASEATRQSHSTHTSCSQNTYTPKIIIKMFLKVIGVTLLIDHSCCCCCCFKSESPPVVTYVKEKASDNILLERTTKYPCRLTNHISSSPCVYFALLMLPSSFRLPSYLEAIVEYWQICSHEDAHSGAYQNFLPRLPLNVLQSRTL